MKYDLIVIGAGPAGMAAAEVVAAHQGKVAVVDAGLRPGGQYYRHSGDDAVHPRGRVVRWQRLTADIDYYPRHLVWHVSGGDGFTVAALVGQDGHAAELVGHAVLLATGAHDRTLPFPGWDLPGVMTAGGVQSLWKGSGVVPAGRTVVAGSGPFLLPVATGVLAGGGSLVGLFEANRISGRTLGLLRSAVRGAEAAGYLARLTRHRVRYHTGHAVVAAEGVGRLEAVTVARVAPDWSVVPGTARRIECDVLATGYGFAPQLELAQTLGCRLTIGADGTPVVAVSATQRTSVAGVYAAGETTGIGGAALAEVEGRLAGYAVVGGRPPGGLLTARVRGRRFAERLGRAFAVRDGWMDWLRQDTLVCRCEEVDVDAVVAARSRGGVEPRSAKLLSRAGMGVCQGRVCGFAVSCLTGDPSRAPWSRVIGQPVGLDVLAGEADGSA